VRGPFRLARRSRLLMSPRRTQSPPVQAPSESENAGLTAIAPYAAFISRPVADVAADLESFATLLIKWNRTHNLVSRETLGELWPRHMADSLQLLPLIQPEDSVFLDALRRDHVLVEPAGKKASFLKTASRELGLDLRVENHRAEDIAAPPRVDVITSRALARLTNLLELTARFWGPATRALLHKGRDYSEELAESRAVWHYDVVVTQSRTDPSGVVLTISNLVRK
jgi:16S rRNA (guanine527-N7)-methyltransferase